MSSQVLIGRRNIKPIFSEPAQLRGFQLEFTQPGIPILEPAFANIAPKQLHNVFGVLHDIPEQSLAAIDSFEGPEYLRTKLEIQGSMSGTVCAWTYRSRNPRYGLKPSRRYLNLMLDGAREFGLPKEYIVHLSKTETCAELPLITAALPILFGLAEKIASKNIIAQKTGYWLLKLLAKTHR